MDGKDQSRNVPESGPERQPRLRASGISKSFPGVKALDNVTIEVLPGEIHAMVGENGAGKSTLMQIVAGVYPPDCGHMELDGRAYTPEDEKAAERAGVAMVFQEGSLFPTLSVAENIFAGRQPVRRFGVIDTKEMFRQTRQLLQDLDVVIDPATLVVNLSPSQRQLVEIAKALSQQVRVLILDEPTSSLTVSEARNLAKNMHRLATRGVAIVYVTHRLAEVFEVADRVTVLKDGKVTGVCSIKGTTPDELIRLEVGRELSFARSVQGPGPGGLPVLEVEDLVAPGVNHASFEVRAGEIVCLAGLVGAGRTELCETIFGMRRRISGRVRLSGVEIAPGHPSQAMKASIGMVPEERREQGLFLAMSVARNISVTNMGLVSRNGVVVAQKVRQLAQEVTDSLHIVTPSIDREVMYLSGGNQQKVLVGKWLSRKPKLLIVDEPTRGVDVGAKAELYEILRGLVKTGTALLVVSSDLPEVLALAHRIVVMAEGRTVGEMSAQDADEVTILQLATPKKAVPPAGRTV